MTSHQLMTRHKRTQKRRRPTSMPGPQRIEVAGRVRVVNKSVDYALVPHAPSAQRRRTCACFTVRPATSVLSIDKAGCIDEMYGLLALVSQPVQFEATFSNGVGSCWTCTCGSRRREPSRDFVTPPAGGPGTTSRDVETSDLSWSFVRGDSRDLGRPRPW